MPTDMSGPMDSFQNAVDSMNTGGITLKDFQKQVVALRKAFEDMKLAQDHNAFMNLKPWDFMPYEISEMEP